MFKMFIINLRRVTGNDFTRVYVSYISLKFLPVEVLIIGTKILVLF